MGDALSPYGAGMQSGLQQALLGIGAGYHRDKRAPMDRLREEHASLTANRDALNGRIAEIEEAIAELEAQPAVAQLLAKIARAIGL